MLLLERLMGIITQYPLESIGINANESTIMIKSGNDYSPDIIISESFNV